MKNFAKTLLILTTAPIMAHAWGGRGHHVICSAAVQLVKEPGLREFLKSRPHTMGHLCNIPDIYWKSLGAVAKVGDAAHFMDFEVLNLKPTKTPLDFSAIQKEYTGTKNNFKQGATVFSVADDFGSLWWRADQFARRVTERKEALSAVVPPANRKEEQDDNLPYNREVYAMMVNMGLLGHFVGDASQPLHNTSDYDGFDTGHGGLHSYFEDASVAEAPADLENKIVQRAGPLRNAPWLKGSVLERMRSLSEISATEIPKVFAKDPLKKKSEVQKDGALEIKIAAERQPPSVGWDRYDSLIIGEMARSARLLATIWDELYVSMGKPKLGAYRSYRYPFTPDFVPPDYILAAPEKAKE